MKSLVVAIAIIAVACDTPPSAPTENPVENQVNQQGKPAPGQPKNAPEKMKGGVPDLSGGIIQQSILLRYNDSGEGDPEPEYSQEALKGMAHVEIKGKIVCDGSDCNSPMILRVQPFIEGKPGSGADEAGGKILSIKTITQLGEYSILCPKMSTPIRMELHVDTNGDGKPTKGERFAVVDRGGMMPSKGLSGMDFDVTDRAETGPMGGPANPESPAPRTDR